MGKGRSRLNQPAENLPGDLEYARLPNDQKLLIDRLCSRFEAALKAGSRPKAEAVLKKLPATLRLAALGELLPLEADYRQREGKPLTLPELEQRFPDVDAAWLADCVRTEAPETELGINVTDELETPVPERLGDYRIVSRLGSGGMGTVYRAVHERMGREVAVKLLRPEIQRNPQLLQRFDREVRAAAKLSHPNIVAALDAREHGGLHFLVTELVEGRDLDLTVRLSGPLPIVDAVECLLQAARGLSYAHAQGVIHRDIKPANLLRSYDGTVKILDMGLARLSNADSSMDVNLTDTGVMMGTAAFMSPEQARDTRKADARSDLYSLGCTLFYLLTGKIAFAGATQIDMILSHVNQPIPSLRKINPQIPVAVDRIFHQLVAKNPDERFQSADELLPVVLDALEECRSPNRHQTMVEHLQGLKLTPPGKLALDLADGTGAQVSPSDFKFAAPEPTARPAIISASKNRPRSWMTDRNIQVAGAAGLIALIALGVIFSGRDDPDEGRVPVIIEGGNSGSGQAGDDQGLKTGTLGNDPLADAGRYVLGFNGLSSYAVASGLQPSAGATYTLEARVRPDSFRTSNIISWLGPDWMAVFVGVDGTPGVARRTSDASFVYSSTQAMELGQWYHIAAVFDVTGMRLFLNGKESELTRQTFELPETQGGFFIGGVDRELLPVDQNDRFFDGLIETVRVTSGQRYTVSFDPLLQFTSDEKTLAAFPLQYTDENSAAVQTDLEGRYPLQLHDTDWIQVTGHQK